MSKPLWLFLAYQAVHGPFSDPPEWERVPYNPEFCNHTSNKNCETYANMLHVLDSGIRNVTNALKQRNVWDKTLVLFVSDNGGTGPGNNYPLRGPKGSPWEGGTRVAAFLSGGFLPKSMRGKHSELFIHVADWYATFASLVGLDPSDTERCKYDIDGMDLWPLLTSSVSQSPREYLPVTKDSIIWKSQYKLITDASATWDYTPNSSRIPAALSCAPSAPCLFDIVKNPGESENLADQFPEIVAQLQQQLASYEVYTSGSMSAAELEPYVCHDKPTAEPSGWPWGPPAYHDVYAGPCCLRKATIV